MSYFTEEDLKNLWADSDYSKENYESDYPTDELIAALKKILVAINYLKLTLN